MSLVLGIDIGTYEAKGVVVDSQGKVFATATRAHSMSSVQPGFAEHDAEEVWWNGLVSLVRSLLAEPGVNARDLKAICCSGIGPCVLPIDDGGRPLRPAILYGVDTRATAQIELINQSLGTDVVVARSGNHLSSQSAGPKIAWLKDCEPEIHRRAHLFVTCQTFLAGRLTGRWVVDHGTAGYFHPLYDLEGQQWDISGCEDFVRHDQLPELAWAGDIAGRVTPEASKATGLPEGIDVLVGSADAPMEALSSGVLAAGDAMLMYGSSHFLIEMTDTPIRADQLYTAPYLFPDSFVLAAGTSTAGTITRWFVDFLGIEDLEIDKVFSQLAGEAALSPPGARGLLALPHFSGERTPLDDPLASGALFGLNLTHTRSDVYRALLEGIAQGVRAMLEQYERLGASPHTIRAVGGGTKNPVWVSAISDITQREQYIISGVGAAYGDTMLAALSLGLVETRDQLAEWISIGRAVQPDLSSAEFYQKQSALWDQFQSETLGMSHALRKLAQEESS